MWFSTDGPHLCPLWTPEVKACQRMVRSLCGRHKTKDDSLDVSVYRPQKQTLIVRYCKGLASCDATQAFVFTARWISSFRAESMCVKELAGLLGLRIWLLEGNWWRCCKTRWLNWFYEKKEGSLTLIFIYSCRYSFYSSNNKKKIPENVISDVSSVQTVQV